MKTNYIDIHLSVRPSVLHFYWPLPLQSMVSLFCGGVVYVSQTESRTGTVAILTSRRIKCLGVKRAERNVLRQSCWKIRLEIDQC